jgi:predicted O-linked N-acetylglucosamine transferase (SPINDLY family)
MMESRRFEEAALLLREALSSAPSDAAILHLLGVVKDIQGYPSEAIPLIRKSLEYRPSDAITHNDLGLAYQSLGQWSESTQAFREAIHFAPDYVEAMYNLARSLACLEKNEEALQWAKRVARSMPHVPEAHHLAGRILTAMKKPQDAIAFLEQTLVIKPGSISAIVELASLYLDEEQYAQAHHVVTSAAPNVENIAVLYKNWADTIRRRNRFSLAIKAYLEALRYTPDDHDVWYFLGLSYLGAAQITKAIESFEEAFKRKPDRIDIKSFVISAMHFSSEYTSKNIFDATREWAHKLCLPKPLTSVDLVHYKNDPEKKLRVGFLSSDMRAHPVGFFLMPLLVTADTSQVEWIGYHNDAAEDFMTHALRGQMSKWRNIHAQTDEQVATMIAQDEVDILIDLNGHTAQHRLSVMALEPAPVQMTWLGYFNTTGVSAIDYIICDSIVIPESEESLYTETPLRLPDAYLCFAPPGFDIEPNLLPAKKNGFITFGSTNYMSKLSDEVLETWSEILKSVPSSRLLIRNPSLSDRQLQKLLQNKFAAYGIQSDRLHFLGEAKKEEFIKTYHEIDILLDTFPYNGGTTTSEALWMGVPVLTLSGDRFVSRVSHTILKQVDMEDWVAFDRTEYIAKAIKKAQDTNALQVLRSRLRNTLMESPLCHAPRFAEHFIASLRGAWIRHCDQST